MSLTLRKLYHISAFSWYAYVVKSLADRGGQELPPGIFVYGGPWKYLTFLNLVSPATLGRCSLSLHVCSRCESLLLHISVIANLVLRTGGGGRPSTPSREHSEPMQRLPLLRLRLSCGHGEKHCKAVSQAWIPAAQ